METLEPQGVDSYFAWGFFDAILQQKEWFSDYIFEEKAEELLKVDPALQGGLKLKQEKDTIFAKTHEKQLAFIYEHLSVLREDTFKIPGRAAGEMKIYYNFKLRGKCYFYPSLIS